jgi:hypothetical protein
LAASYRRRRLWMEGLNTALYSCNPRQLVCESLS